MHKHKKTGVIKISVSEGGSKFLTSLQEEDETFKESNPDLILQR